MMVDQGREATPVIHCHAITPGRLRQYFLDEQGIDVYQTDLQQMKRQYSQFLIFHTVSRKFTPLAVEDEVIGAIPVLHHIQALVNFAL